MLKMDLDGLSSLVEETKISLNNKAKIISLQDVIDKLKYLIPKFDEDDDAYLLKILWCNTSDFSQRISEIFVIFQRSAGIQEYLL